MQSLIQQNAWVLAYLTFSRFAYLLLIFPFVLSLGRRAFHRFEKWQNKSSSEDGNEQQPLLKSAEKMPGEEANHFDVDIACVSPNC